MIDWRHWHNEPYLVGGLILLGWLYALAVGPLRRKLGGPTAFPTSHACAFYGALLVFYLAVGSPLDQIGERFLLSAHMLQHLLLVYPAAALFLLGVPPWLFVRRAPLWPARVVPGFLLTPVVCALVFTFTVTVWHAPALYERALLDKNVHVWEHLAFFGAALFFWWPLLSPAPDRPPLSPPAQILYLLGVVIGMTPLFAFIVFSPEVLYPTYEFAPRIVPTLDAAADQLLAGVGMKLTGMAVALLMMSVAFQRWYRSESPAG
ncbi:MAG TPA: cytochrome c oxidase assembly protein [Opitutaceae bacterium]|nr:cytochrome c oxidase assembly protein [Opitutaceae bacterium]